MDSLIVYIGTTSCAVGLDLERKRALEIAWLTRQSHSTNAFIERLHSLRDSLSLLAADIDATGVYQLSAPLDDVVASWPIGTFVECPLPGQDLIDNIKDGRHKGRFEHINPETVRQTMQNAAGGTRVNGWLATETNRDSLEGAIRQRLQFIINQRREQANTNNQIRCILVRTSLGGFSSGAGDPIHQMILQIANEMGLTISFMSFLLVPGTNAAKDKANSLAVSAGVIKEQVAHSTGRHYHRELLMGSQRAVEVSSIFNPTFILSDTNNAPYKPSSLSIERFNGMVSELLHAIVFTGLGSKIEAIAGDMDIRSQELTVTGEPRFGRSAGISVIYLDRMMGFSYAQAKLRHRFFNSQLQLVNATAITGNIRGFFETHQIIEGADVQELSERLIQSVDVDDPVCINRFCELFRQTLAGKDGLELLIKGKDLFEYSVTQTGDFQTSFVRRRESLLQALQRSIYERTDQFARNRRTSLMAAKQWIEEAMAVAENMSIEAAKDTPRFEQQVDELQNNINHIEKDYIPRVVRKNFIYKFFRRNRIKAAGRAYIRSLENCQIATMRLQAHLVAIEVLTGLTELLKHRLSEVQIAIDTISLENDKVAAELAKIADYRPDFNCPVGLALLNGQSDLDEFYTHMLPEGNEEQAIGDIYTRLQRVQDIVKILGDQTRLNDDLNPVIDTTFRQKVERLHVVDYLLRRYPQPEELGAVLRERDRESFEYLQLKDSSKIENGLYIMRLLGIDLRRIGNTKELLAQYGYTRTPYEAIDIDDPERIIFLQVRAAFPYSDWTHFEAANRVYKLNSKKIPFEKYHSNVGERNLPVPGKLLTPIEARTIILKGWLQERVEYIASQGWILFPATDDTGALELGRNLEVLLGQEGYGYAVDVVSHYNNFYLTHGPTIIQQRLTQLFQIRNGTITPATDTDRQLAALADDKNFEAIEYELDWWQKNSVPGAMEWHAPVQTSKATVK